MDYMDFYRIILYKSEFSPKPEPLAVAVRKGGWFASRAVEAGRNSKALFRVN